ncbi:MAG: lipid-binding SYLF domain-containing protein [Pirellulaceae bacterium]
MGTQIRYAWVAAGLFLSAGLPEAWGQFKQEATVRQAMTVFQETLVAPASGIPAALLQDAHGVAIIPGVLKGSFIVGARFGDGVLLVRDGQGGWHAPVFVTLTGGNVGWQVGVQSTDVLLVFKTRKSVDGILSGKFTIGADAAAAAGPVGRQAAAATDGRLQAEIYSYSRSRGLFAGISLDGSVIRVDQLANATYYRAAGPGQPAVVPAEAVQLVNLVWQATGPADALPAASPGLQPVLAQQYAKDEASSVRDELARVAPHLFRLLDPMWQNHLALPGEIFSGQSHPSPQSLEPCLQRFEQVRTDARYQALAERPEFQSVYGLLKHYVQTLTATAPVLSLPAPPR